MTICQLHELFDIERGVKMFMKDELGKTWQEVVAAYFQIQCVH
jgi:hypothetical protein